MKYFDLLLLSDSYSKDTREVFNFLRLAISRFHPNSLGDVSLFFSAQKNVCYFLFRFEFQKFLPSYLNWFNTWIHRLNLKAVEFMGLHEKEREELLQKISAVTEQKFAMPFDLNIVQREIEKRLGIFGEKREHERVRAEIVVKFKTPKDFIKKYTEDISKGGIFIKTINPLPYETNVMVTLVLPDTNKIDLAGRVVYILKEDDAKVLGRSPGIGIQFVDVPTELSKKLEEFIEKMKEKETIEFEEKREHERVRAEIKLTFKTIDGFIQRYTEDISKGGIFIKTNNPLPFDARVNIIFVLPDSSQIELPGRVVYILDEEEAKTTLHNPGMGVQFMDVPAEVNKKVEAFIEEVKKLKLDGKNKKN
ncbi:MAG TPA: TIGR02266 family protein [bacterium]